MSTILNYEAGGLPKSGRHFRLYVAGAPVGAGFDRNTWEGLQQLKASPGQTNLRYTRTENREDVYELGNPETFGIAQFNSKHSITIDHVFVDWTQLKKQLGFNVDAAEIPDFPLFFDVVEKSIVPGSEKTSTERAYSYTLYERVSISGSELARAAQATSTISITGDCSERPRTFNGIPAFEILTGDGVTTDFTLGGTDPGLPVIGPLDNGESVIRVENPYDPLGPNSVVMKENVDFTVDGLTPYGATATEPGVISFVEAPLDGSKILVVYLTPITRSIW